MSIDAQQRLVNADDLALASETLIAHIETYRKVLLAAAVPGPPTDDLETTMAGLGDRHRCWPAIRSAMRAAPRDETGEVLDPISARAAASSAGRLVVAWERIRREKVAGLLDDLTIWLRP